MAKHAKPLPGTVIETSGALTVRRRLDLPKDERFKVRFSFTSEKQTVTGLVFIYRLYLKDGVFRQGSQMSAHAVAVLLKGEGADTYFPGNFDTQSMEKINAATKGYAKKHPPIELDDGERIFS